MNSLSDGGAAPLRAAGRSPIRARIRAYIADNLLLGEAADLGDDTSLLESGLLDSTGAIEMVAFLEQSFAIAVTDHDLMADNFDSVARVATFVESKLAAR
jgi:acyl carrier protein